MMLLLSHGTLATGKHVLHPRSVLDSDTERTLRPLVRELTGGGAMIPRTRDVPGRAGYAVQCLKVHQAAPPLFRVYGPAPDPIPEDGADLPCLVSFGVGVDTSAAAAALWRNLHDFIADDGGRAVTDRNKPPIPPWCGVTAHPALLNDPPAAQWLASFERNVAWCVILESEDAP